MVESKKGKEGREEKDRLESLTTHARFVPLVLSFSRSMVLKGSRRDSDKTIRLQKRSRSEKEGEKTFAG